MKQAASKAFFLFGLFFGPEDGEDIFLRNVAYLSTKYTALYPRTQTNARIVDKNIIH
jgi:hypothetical protein